ncbi:spore germination lipoprotein GerD [Oceanobacillus halotolerans]|uniref:spore germination lipoprotein GerD n=1 Tax=Oceanobacillus halotolerans TaxID=2663380 RepID=UPI0013DA6792|nr:spore germination lipoprotein GerD [Oceanobacillus halotolerans]
MVRAILISFIGLALFITACGGGQSTSGEDGEYDTTKKMVVDILQTEDGKKALREILTDEEMKEELVINSEVVKSSISNTLTSDKGTEMWSKLFEDPEFVKTYAESISSEQKKLMKDLMSDSEYQQQMLDVLKDPKMSDQILSVLKGQEFQSHLEESIQQTLETPTFQAKIQEILIKAAEKQGSGESGQGGGGSGGGSGGSGGGSGGGSS